MNPHGLEHLLVTLLVACFVLAAVGLGVLIFAKLFAPVTGAF